MTDVKFCTDDEQPDNILLFPFVSCSSLWWSIIC